MKKVYYGWYVVALSMVVYAAVVGSTYGAFGVFVHPVSAELKLTRAEMNTTLILVGIGMAAVAPFIGRLLDRTSPKRMMLVGGLSFALAYVGMGLSPSVLLSSGLLLTLLPIAYLGGCSITMTVLMARWFTVYRGRAMMLSSIGMSLGNVIVTPVIGYLVEQYGWRQALMITGVVVGGLTALAALIVRERPGPDDVEVRSDAPIGSPPPPVAEAAGRPMSVGAILALPQFWVLSLSAALALGVCQALSATLVPLALENGATMLQATSLMSICGVFAIAGGLLLSLIADKVNRTTLLAVFFLGMTLLNGLLVTGVSYSLLAVCAAILGVSSGAITPVFYALLADRFGTPSFGTVRGLVLLVTSVAGMVAVRFGGEVYDRTKSYDAMFMTFTAAAAIAVVMMLASRFTRAPVHAAPATSSAS